METIAAQFKLKGHQIEVKKETKLTTCQPGDGSAPWKWGTKIRIVKYTWWVDGVYNSSFGWSKDTNIQNILKKQYMDYL